MDLNARLTQEFDRAVRLLIDDPTKAEVGLRRVRRCALRGGSVEIATACLGPLSMLASARYDHQRAFRYAQRLVNESPIPAHLILLGSTAKRVGKLTTAINSFREALASSENELRDVAVACYESVLVARDARRAQGR